MSMEEAQEKHSKPLCAVCGKPTDLAEGDGRIIWFQDHGDWYQAIHFKCTGVLGDNLDEPAKAWLEEHKRGKWSGYDLYSLVNLIRREAAKI